MHNTAHTAVTGSNPPSCPPCPPTCDVAQQQVHAALAVEDVILGAQYQVDEVQVPAAVQCKYTGTGSVRWKWANRLAAGVRWCSKTQPAAQITLPHLTSNMFMLPNVTLPRPSAASMMMGAPRVPHRLSQ
jgi:hypothetical protein